MVTKGYTGTLSNFYSLGWQVYLYNERFGQLCTIYSFGSRTGRYYQTNISDAANFPVDYDSTLLMVRERDEINKIAHVVRLEP